MIPGGNVSNNLGGIVALAASTNTMDDVFSGIQKRIKTHTKQEFINNKATIDSYHVDIYNPKNIIVMGPSPDFKLTYLDLVIEGRKLLRIDFDLLNYLKDIIVSERIFTGTHNVTDTYVELKTKIYDI